MTEVYPPIVIVGPARSGTSVTAQLIAAHGVWTGNCRQATQKNPHGFYENRALLAIRDNKPVDPEVIRETLEADGYRGGPWLVKHGMKGWPTWLAIGPRFVCVRREIGPTVRSQMRWQPDTKSKGKRRDMIKKQHRQLDEIRDRYGGVDFWPDDVMRGNDTPLRRLIEHLGLEYDPAAAMRCVDLTIWGRQ